MTKYETKIKNSLNLPCHTNTLYEIESTEDLLKVDFFFFNFISRGKRSNEGRYKIEN